MADIIVVTPEGRTWVIKHNDGILGYARGRDEARRIARSLVEWIEAQGRSVELRVEDQVLSG